MWWIIETIVTIVTNTSVNGAKYTFIDIEELICQILEMCLILLFGAISFIMGFINSEAIEARALMIEPPQRSSLWRFRYNNTKINIADSLLNCGGWEVRIYPVIHR